MPDNLVVPADHIIGETWKARERRVRTGWFDRYAPADRSGIDIGCQRDPLNDTFRRWDVIFGDGDATYMSGVPDNVFHTTYASHVLEHLVDPILALWNWYRITEPDGHLIVVVPHRDLYEKKESPPSNWNGEHKWFFLPTQKSNIRLAPGVLYLDRCILDAIPNANIVSFTTLQDGYADRPPNVHAAGEYSIEAIIQKNDC